MQQGDWKCLQKLVLTLSWPVPEGRCADWRRRQGAIVASEAGSIRARSLFEFHHAESPTWLFTGEDNGKANIPIRHRGVPAEQAIQMLADHEEADRRSPELCVSNQQGVSQQKISVTIRLFLEATRNISNTANSENKKNTTSLTKEDKVRPGPSKINKLTHTLKNTITQFSCKGWIANKKTAQCWSRWAKE